MLLERELLAAAFSSMLGVEIVANPEVAPYTTKLSALAAHESLFVSHDNVSGSEAEISEQSEDSKDPEAMYLIQVTSIDGQTYSIEVCNLMLVHDLKLLIQERINVSPRIQNLRYHNKSLNPNKTLGSYGLNEISHIFMFPIYDRQDVMNFISADVISDIFSKLDRRMNPFVIADRLRLNIDIVQSLKRNEDNLFEKLNADIEFIRNCKEKMKTAATQNEIDEVIEQLNGPLSCISARDSQGFNQVRRKFCQQAIELISTFESKHERFPSERIRHISLEGLDLAIELIQLLDPAEDSDIFKLAFYAFLPFSRYIWNNLTIHLSEIQLDDLKVFLQADHLIAKTIRTSSNTIQILVELTTREVIEVTVDQQDFVRDVKQSLSEIGNYPCDQLKLLYERELLTDQRTLESYQIRNGSHLHCILNQTGGNTIAVKVIKGGIVQIEYQDNEKIIDIKAKIRIKLDIPESEQLLIYKNETLKDTDNVPSSENVIWLYTSEIPVAFYLDPEDFNPAYNFDFRGLDDEGKTFHRGEIEYKRPIGWMRYALNIRKYGEDLKWLGTGKGKEVWPVSYHGTSEQCYGSIAMAGYLVEKNKRDLYGKSNYSTPVLKCAEAYATEFERFGKRYKVVLQNRVNLSEEEKTSKIIKKAHCGHTYFVTENKNIRPYGVLIRELNKDEVKPKSGRPFCKKES